MKKETFYFSFPEKPSLMQDVSLIKRVKKEDIVYPCHMFLDQSTKTGYVIVDDLRRLVTAGCLEKTYKESLQDYKFGLKEELTNLINEYDILRVWYEHAYDKANHFTTEVLYYIKHMIEDLSYEMEGKLEVLGIDHARWKSLLAKPGKFKKDEDDKVQVKRLVSKYYPLLNLNEHITDALGMMIGVVWKSKEKTVFHNARINKKLPVYVEVVVKKKDESIEDLVLGLGKRFYKKMEDEDSLVEFEFDTKMDEKLNCRYYLHFKDIVCYAKLPHYKNTGIIYLHYGIIPKNLEEDDEVYVIGVRKK